MHFAKKVGLESRFFRLCFFLEKKAIYRPNPGWWTPKSKDHTHEFSLLGLSEWELAADIILIEFQADVAFLLLLLDDTTRGSVLGMIRNA